MKVWTKKQQVVSLSTAESELYAAVKKRVRRHGGPERCEGRGLCVWVEPTSGRHSDDVPSQLQRVGQSATRCMQNSWIQEGLQVRKVRHEEKWEQT